MKSRGLGIAVAVLVATGIAWFWFGSVNKQSIPISSSPFVPTNLPAMTAAVGGNGVEQALQSAAVALRSAQTADEKRTAIAHLREVLSSGSTNDLIAAVRAVLDSGVDEETGLGFRIGGGGALLEAPTLRTWLLDQLAHLDPAAAAMYAHLILDSSSSPDEWAIALRNLARYDTSPDARALLEIKTGELLRNESWQRDPSVGYLEAFDTAVLLGGTTLLRPLADLVSKKDNQAVAQDRKSVV